MNPATARQEAKAQRADLRGQIKKLADLLAKVEDKERRASGSTEFLASGSQNVDIVWSKPYPDTFYGVWIQLYTTNPAQVHAVPLPATKTASGITIAVVAAAAIGTVTVDVLAERTA